MNARSSTVRLAAALCSMVLLAAACTSEEPESVPSPAAVGDAAPDQYSATDIPEDRITDAIGQVDGIVDDVMSRSGVPGMAVAVVHGGEIVYAKGFGVREVGKPDLVDADTVFQIASVSKSIAASCVAKAVSDGVVEWSDPVIEHLPDFALSDPAVTAQVTIGDLFSHRSGLPGGVGDDLEGLGFDREQVIRSMRDVPLNPFRISYGYSNFGLTVGAEAAAAAAGKPWEELCRDDLYNPLSMASTSSSHAEFLTRDNRATLHFPVDGGFDALYQRDADAQSPAGGVSSTVNDLAAWMNMSLAAGKVGGEQLIDADALLEAHTPQIDSNPGKTPDSRSRFYGYGVNVETTSTGHVKWSHSGAFYVGAATAYAMLPAADVGIVVLTNASPVGAAEAVTTSFSDVVRTGAVERDWLGYYGPLFEQLFVNRSAVVDPAPADAAPPRPLADYVGNYRNDYAGEVSVAEKDGELAVTIGPDALSAELTPYNGDVFSWTLPGNNGDPISAVTFAGDAGGKAATMTIESLMMGDFTRV